MTFLEFRNSLIEKGQITDNDFSTLQTYANEYGTFPDGTTLLEIRMLVFLGEAVKKINDPENEICQYINKILNEH